MLATLKQVCIMFLVRRAKPEDVPTLLKLAKMVHFINLPADRGIIESKVTWSRQCFLLAHETQDESLVGQPSKPAQTTPPPATPKPRGKGARKDAQAPATPPTPPTAPTSHADPAAHHGVLAGGLKGLTGKSPLFMFVLEEIESAGVIGTSQIISRMGGPGHPNISLQLARKEMFSRDLQTGVTHTVFRRYLDESGPTEIGGLILQPSFRGHRQKLGRLISLIRFHYMALYRQMISDRVIAELMGPMSADGHVPFWEHFGRHFINMTYDQADRFCQESKEFMLSLLPSEDVYLTLLAPECRAAVGQVGEDTRPAKRLLEKQGFKHFQRVDPFDGGPHLEAHTDEITMVRQTRLTTLAQPVKDAVAGASGLREYGVVSVVDSEGEFRATQSAYGLDRAGKVILPRQIMDLLRGEPGMSVGATPLEHGHAAPAAKPATSARPRTARPTSA
ncbi:MAG: arginine N-succinyltransferase [Phycisphaerales bacterium]|nr:arginine N-succinyltransferase [Phycisphaerales bacterium]